MLNPVLTVHLCDCLVSRFGRSVNLRVSLRDNSGSGQNGNAVVQSLA
jgi:hypothetical protein